MTIDEFRAKILGVSGEALKELGVYDNYPIILRPESERVRPMLLTCPEFREWEGRANLLYFNKSGQCSIVQIRPIKEEGSRYPGYGTLVMLHADYYNQGREQAFPYEWLHPIRDAAVRIIDLISDLKVAAIYRASFLSESWQEILYQPQ